ncbi:DUF1573 domain-containing protein [Solitalea sp. MAHUQ-68]|uniref:DUF1573 domain-containing protein n=1 Tax=Solitalea agri TaxID=2953739 RepID=A0A9X2EYS4_9SPHI|nr:DUF1573 domain-containing protein [Solitalea agri]MCO4291482.1 DUF1573 domain-containing protein [Solitalea agri]
MKKTILILVVAAFAVACNKGSKNHAPSSDLFAKIDSSQLTVIKFDEDKFDFGKITEGEVVEHSFKFVNKGKFPLIIKSAIASCGCTVPSKPDEPIAPGATGVIDVKFNSKGKQGLQDKHITIFANTNPTVSTLELVGEVQEN